MTCDTAYVSTEVTVASVTAIYTQSDRLWPVRSLVASQPHMQSRHMIPQTGRTMQSHPSQPSLSSRRHGPAGLVKHSAPTGYETDLGQTRVSQG